MKKSKATNTYRLPACWRACTAGLLLGAIVGTAAQADENFQLNSVSLLGTTRAKPNAITGMGTNDGNELLAQFEHLGITNWGYFYFDLETFHGHGVGALPPYGNNGSAAQMFANVTPSISLAKVLGRSFTLGPVSDISLIADARMGSYYQYQARGIGLSFNFYIPGFDWFESGLLTQNSTWNVEPTTFSTNTGKNYTLDKNKWLWRTFLISKPIDWGNQRFHYTFFSFVNSTGNGASNRHGTEYFVRNDLLWEIGGNSDYQVGIRYEYTRHQNSPLINFGHNHYTSHVPYLMFKGTL